MSPGEEQKPPLEPCRKERHKNAESGLWCLERLIQVVKKSFKLNPNKWAKACAIQKGKGRDPWSKL